MNIRTINELIDIRGKHILLRDDFNVQIVDGKITDAFRIEQSMPTIRRLQAAGARIAILAHLGRPKGERNMKYTLQPIADFMKIPLIFDCLDKDFLTAMKDGDAVLLENVRFYAEEEKNDSVFAAKLAAGFDFFVNDAFAVSHRAHASTTGVAKILPSYAGELLTSEIASLTRVMEEPARPLLGIVSGAKVGSKINVLKSLVKLCDRLIVAGGLGTAFRIAIDSPNVSDMLYEPEAHGTILEIAARAREKHCELLLPIDKGVAVEYSAAATRIDKVFDEIADGEIIMDEGPQSIARDIAAIDESAMLIWNGSVGMAEWQPTWSVGTFALARHIAARTRAGKLQSIIGGGDVVAALEATGTKGDMSYVSTGGGAFLEFIEGLALPGIEVLEN